MPFPFIQVAPGALQFLEEPASGRRGAARPPKPGRKCRLLAPGDHSPGPIQVAHGEVHDFIKGR